MSVVAPSPSSSRGEVVLQPSYFTSSIFVDAFRIDVEFLTRTYKHHYSQGSLPIQPFSLFKSLWVSQGWKWIHFLIYDDRARATFLKVVFRLFLEHACETQDPCRRVAALFGLYIFFYTQPKYTSPPVHISSQILVPIDHFTSLVALRYSLNSDDLFPLIKYVSFVLSTFWADEVFFLTPRAELGAMNPRSLPREILIGEEMAYSLDDNAPKKKGRPAKHDKVKKIKRAFDNLDKWLDATSPSATHDQYQNNALHLTLHRYRAQKSLVLDRISAPSRSDPIQIGVTTEQANRLILQRLQATSRLFPSEGPTDSDNETASVLRVERAIDEIGKTDAIGWRGGALNLLEGAGKLS